MRASQPRSPVALLAAAVLLAAGLLTGCALPTTRHEPAVIAMPSGGGDVPLTWSGGDFVATVRINDSDELPFLLDTGSSLCVLAPSQLRRLSLETSSAPRYVRGAGDSRWSMVRKGTIDEMVVVGDRGDIRFEQLDFWAIPLPGAFAGLFGLSVFGDLLLTLDGPARRMRCSEGSLPPPDHATVIPFQFQAGVPVIRVRLGDKEVHVAVDSGFDGHISVPETIAADLALSVSGKDVVYHTVHGTWHERMHLLEGDLRIGSHVIPNPPVLVGVGPARIGTKILERFAVTFDQRAKRISFLPGPAGTSRTNAPLVAPMTLPE